MTMSKGKLNKTSQLLIGKDEMADLVRSTNWDASSIGPIERWPASVLSAVNVCLNSHFPMVLWLGPDLNILYNSAWAPILGKRHPEMLAAPGKQVWPEIWNIIGPMLEGVLKSGEATWAEDMLLPLERNGFTEECYFTYSYSPIFTSGGKAEGVFTAVTETTLQVISQRRLSTLNDLSLTMLNTKTVEDTLLSSLDVLNGNKFDFPLNALFFRKDDTFLANESDVNAQLFTPLLVRHNFYKIGNKDIAFVNINSREQINFPNDNWGGEIQRVVFVPLLNSRKSEIAAILAMVVAPWLNLDDEFKTFIELTKSQLESSVANAQSYENEVDRANKLAELDNAKSMFFSNVSHELRTPLTLILSPLSELLEQTNDFSNETKITLNLMYKNAVRLQKLVNGLLEFSRIEAGKLTPQFEKINIAKFTVGLADLFRSAIESEGIEFKVYCSVKSEIIIDPDMWEKIVINLLSNAFKYSKSGTISISLMERKKGLELVVEDTGIGIKPEDLNKIFSRFHRVEGAASRTHEGTGIGLSVVKELIALHDGTIEVKSTVGEGSEFIVKIPIKHDPSLEATALNLKHITYAHASLDEIKSWSQSQSSNESTSTTSPSQSSTMAECESYILVADDNNDMRDFIVRTLSKFWKVIGVSDGQEVLDYLTAHEKPDILISDVMMPKIDGLTLLKKIRSAPDLNTMQVMLISARAGEEASIEALQLGADDYLVKPFVVKNLIARVNAILSTSHIRRETEELKQGEVKRINEELVDSNEKLDRFAMVAAHDLKTPLRHIVSYINMLENHEPNEEEKALWIKIVAKGAKRMQLFIDDLLEFSHVTNQTKFTSVDLNQCLVDVLELMSLTISECGAIIQSDELPTLVVSDSLIRQLFQNLISNAIKFARPNTKIQIDINSKETKTHWLVTIRDNGIGIEPQYLEKVFDLFYRLHSRDEIEGTGIGLSSCKKIVELHGGSIGIESVIEKGTTINFTLSKSLVTN